MPTGLWAVAKCQTRLKTGATNNARLVLPREEVHFSEDAHAAIPVDIMPAVSADSAGCVRPIVGIGRTRAYDLRRVEE